MDTKEEPGIRAMGWVFASTCPLHADYLLRNYEEIKKVIMFSLKFYSIDFYVCKVDTHIKVCIDYRMRIMFDKL